MIHKMYPEDHTQMTAPKEGDLYKRITVFGKLFELRYGYYEEFERHYNEPMPIYPDFTKSPMYTENGKPFVTQMQDACPHYSGREISDQDCGGCGHYLHGEAFLGLCDHPENQLAQRTVVDL